MRGILHEAATSCIFIMFIMPSKGSQYQSYFTGEAPSVIPHDRAETGIEIVPNTQYSYQYNLDPLTESIPTASLLIVANITFSWQKHH